MSLLTGNKFDPEKDIPDLNGKVYVITGGSAGIGFGIVAHLLQHNPAKILLLSNKKQHAEAAMEELKEYGDVSRVHWVHCDLSDLKQVDQVARMLKAEEKQIDALICNAGLGVGSYWETADSIESHFQVNYLSQLHLTLHLLPNLRNTPRSRLVLQSSDLHRAARPSTAFSSLADDINQDLGATYLYNRSKLTQVLFIHALTRKMDDGQLGFRKYDGKENSVYANATHPGGVSTDQQEQAVEAYGLPGKIGVKMTRPLMKDPVNQGCRPALFAATAEDVVAKGIRGAYIVPDRKVVEPSGQSRDEGLQEQLWDLSLRLLEERLGRLEYGFDEVANGDPGKSGS